MIASGSPAGMEVFRKQVKQLGCTSVTECASSGDCKRRFGECDYDIILINTPLTDEFGTELAALAVKNTSAGVIVVVKSDIFEDVRTKMDAIGVLTVPKPLSKPVFEHTFRLAAATRARICEFKRENDTLRRKLDDFRVISRAKCLMIRYQDYTEEEAHKYIEKLAMDKRRSRREIAEDIIDAFEIE